MPFIPSIQVFSKLKGNLPNLGGRGGRDHGKRKSCAQQSIEGEQNSHIFAMIVKTTNRNLLYTLGYQGRLFVVVFLEEGCSCGRGGVAREVGRWEDGLLEI